MSVGTAGPKDWFYLFFFFLCLARRRQGRDSFRTSREGRLVQTWQLTSSERFFVWILDLSKKEDKLELNLNLKISCQLVCFNKANQLKKKSTKLNCRADSYVYNNTVTDLQINSILIWMGTFCREVANQTWEVINLSCTKAISSEALRL